MPDRPPPLPSPQTLAAIERLDSLCRKGKRSGRWLILSHDNPDPDALVSAALLGVILKRRFGVSYTLGYAGIIGRAENQAMVRSLRLRLSRLAHLTLGNYKHFALVDTQPGTGNNQLPEEIVPEIVIDHHPLRKRTTNAALWDIRPHYGATASIVAEYLLASGIEPSREAATGLVYAIRTETQDFSREAQGPDRVLYDYLNPLVNKRALGKIQHPKLPLSYFRTLHQSLANMEGVENVVLCHLSATPTPDNVPQIADLLLRLEGKTWCMATGIYEQRLYLALRTSNPRADAGRAMRRILGRKGKGGGHGMIAGGWFPLDPDEDGTASQNLLTGRLLRLLKKDPERLVAIRVDEP